jgi:hypothetical protein
MLQTLLDSHPAVICFPELLNFHKHNNSVTMVLNQLKHAAASAAVRRVGFKLQSWQIPESVLSEIPKLSEYNKFHSAFIIHHSSLAAQCVAATNIFERRSSQWHLSIVHEADTESFTNCD